MQILNLENHRNSENTMFLGKPMGISNLVDCKYPIFKTLYRDQLSFVWTPDEISMTKDRGDFENMSEVQRFIFESNLSFQTMGDSFLGKGIDAIIKHITLNELYLSFKTHEWFEACIHTPSYSHIIEGIYNQPAERFYAILQNEEITKRAKISTQKFNDLLNCESEDPRLEIIGALVGLLSLESISFYNSFLTSFYFAKNGLMCGTGDEIQLIARDENLHKANCINTLKNLMKYPEEGFFDFKDLIKEKLLSSFYAMAEQEFEWIEHLLGRGELPGLTVQGLKRYVKFLTNRAVLDIGFTKNEFLFEETVNPYPWVRDYQGSTKSIQPPPQEVQLTHYIKGGKNDLDNLKF